MGLLFSISAQTLDISAWKWRPSVGVIAFEPQSALVRTIRCSADLNRFDNIVVFEVLVGDRTGESDFLLAESSIHASAVTDSGRKGKSVVRKQMVRIDESRRRKLVRLEHDRN